MELYNFDIADKKMDEIGLAKHFRSYTDYYRQFCLGGSSLHVKTKRKKQFILYAIAMDFGNLKLH